MKTINNILKFIALLLLYILFANIPIIFLSMMGIDYTNWPPLIKYSYMFICNIVTMIIIMGIYYKTLKNDFKKFFNKNFLNNLETPFKYWLIGFIVMIISNLILGIVTKGIAGNEEAVRDLMKQAPIYMAFDICIYAPILEELIFRKSIRDITNKKWLYVLLSGLIFGFLHVIGTLSNPIDLLYLIPYSSVGLAFAYTYYKTNNIYSTITMHFLHNTMSFILLILAGTAG